MTTQARVALSDCQGALDSLAHCEYGAEWRRRWVTVVTLQRAVGHVLDKVDGTSSPRMALVIKTRWSLLNKTKPEPPFFGISSRKNAITYLRNTASPDDMRLDLTSTQWVFQLAMERSLHRQRRNRTRSICTFSTKVRLQADTRSMLPLRRSRGGRRTWMKSTKLLPNRWLSMGQNVVARPSGCSDDSRRAEADELRILAKALDLHHVLHSRSMPASPTTDRRANRTVLEVEGCYPREALNFCALGCSAHRCDANSLSRSLS